MGGVVTPPLDDLKTLDLEPYRKLAGKLAGGRDDRPYGGAGFDRWWPR